LLPIGNMGPLIVEALFVGLGLMILGFLVLTLMKALFGSGWLVVALGLFVAGFLFHLTAEMTGVNRWYCLHGNACTS